MASDSYGAIESSENGPRSEGKWKRVSALGFLMLGIAAVGLWSQQSSSGVLKEIDNLDKHYCPLWSTFCKQHDQCLTKYHGGVLANPVSKDLCEDYVSDCNYYCEECGWSDSACTSLDYCTSLFDSCMDPTIFIDGPPVSNNPVCPHGYEQVGVLGSGVSGCGISGCDDATQADSIDMCSSICDGESTCNSFTFYHNGQHPVCNLYTTSEANGPLGSAGSPTVRRILCKKLAEAPTAILNPKCGFSGSGSSIVQTDRYYPACPANSRLFGLALGGFCCSGDACAPGQEGDGSTDVICAIEGNPAAVYNNVTVAACTGYQTDKACLWVYGSAEAENSGVSRTDLYSNYMVRAVLSYSGVDAGLLFRVQSATDAAAAHYNLKFEGNKETDNLNVYYFDGSTETMVGWQGEGEVQVKLETGPLSEAPADGPAMIAAVDGAVATPTAGFCSIDNADLGHYTNKNTCGGGVDSNIAYKISATFYVAEEGDWFFDFNVDFGWGGIVQFDGVDSAEGFQAGAMWWGGDYNNAMPVDITHTMTEGWHTMVAYGAEACCDGPSNVKFQVPGDDTLYSLTETNLKAVQPAPKPAVEANDMHTLELQVQGQTFTVLLNNELYGTFSDANIATGVIGLRTWKASMQVHNLQFLTLAGFPFDHKYNGNMVGEGEWTLLVDGVVESSSVTPGEVIPIEYSAGARTLAVEVAARDERTYLAAVGTHCEFVGETECQKIADERGQNMHSLSDFMTQESMASYPNGCFYYSSAVYFNPLLTGGSYDAWQQFCYGDGVWELIAYQVNAASNLFPAGTRDSYSYADDGHRMMKIGDMDWSDPEYQLNGKYSMKIVWDDGVTVEWSQTSTPMESAITGFEIISAPEQSAHVVGSINAFEGLGRSNAAHSCIIDGNGQRPNWWNCIGLISPFQNNYIPGYNLNSVGGFELYIAKQEKTPAFAYFAYNHRGTDVPVRSVLSDGKYFTFEVSDVTAALGRALVHSGEVLQVTNTRTQEQREAKLWGMTLEGVDNGNGYGRWAVGEAPGQWASGDLFTLQSMTTEHGSMSSASASAADWKCTNAVSDPTYAWTAAGFDRSGSEWRVASVLTNDQYSAIPSTVGSGLSWIGINRTVADAGTKMMCVLET